MKLHLDFRYLKLRRPPRLFGTILKDDDDVALVEVKVFESEDHGKCEKGDLTKFYDMLVKLKE